ncbi:hypothetical protein TcCL_NonESM07273 [Trypanosoma cruzi]|nr:hypothetical protein TcCL_NonESM07273 [Trypanosoma cruzi]
MKLPCDPVKNKRQPAQMDVVAEKKKKKPLLRQRVILGQEDFRAMPWAIQMTRLLRALVVMPSARANNHDPVKKALLAPGFPRQYGAIDPGTTLRWTQAIHLTGVCTNCGIQMGEIPIN